MHARGVSNTACEASLRAAHSTCRSRLKASPSLASSAMPMACRSLLICSNLRCATACVSLVMLRAVALRQQKAQQPLQQPAWGQYLPLVSCRHGLDLPRK